MWLFDEYGIDVGYVVMGMAGIILIMFIMLIVTMAKNSSMRKKYIICPRLKTYSGTMMIA